MPAANRKRCGAIAGRTRFLSESRTREKTMMTHRLRSQLGVRREGYTYFRGSHQHVPPLCFDFAFAGCWSISTLAQPWPQPKR